MGRLPSRFVPLREAVAMVLRERHPEEATPSQPPSGGTAAGAFPAYERRGGQGAFPEYQRRTGPLAGPETHPDMARLGDAMSRAALLFQQIEEERATGKPVLDPHRAVRDEVAQALVEGTLQAWFFPDGDGDERPISAKHWRDEEREAQAFRTGYIELPRPPAPVPSPPRPMPPEVLQQLLQLSLLVGASERGQVAVKRAALESWLRPARATAVGATLDPPAWMLAHLTSEANAGRKPKRDDAMRDCRAALKCSARAALAAWNAAPKELRRKRTDTDRALIGR